MRELERLHAENAALKRVVENSASALRAFECGDGKPELARVIAAEADLVLAKVDQSAAAARAIEASDGRDGATATFRALVTAARTAVDAITHDDSGNAGQGGNGGLISRGTIRKVDELRIALRRFERATAAEVR